MPFSHAISHPFIVYFTKILSIHEPCQARHPGNIEDHPPPARSVHHDQRLRATRSYEVGTFSMTSLLLQAWALWRPFRTLKLLWLNCSWCCRPAEHAMTPRKLLFVGAHHVKAMFYIVLYCRSCRCFFGEVLQCRSPNLHVHRLDQIYTKAPRELVETKAASCAPWLPPEPWSQQLIDDGKQKSNEQRRYPAAASMTSQP